jgi:glycosyltransferase involved in cell wall biosynthesis
MRCPTLSELPPPPPGRTGWPWTEESPQLPDTMPDGNRWPRISIVTPSFNQGQFIEETIRSVLLQGYPDLEYIIIDGASTDNSVDIIKKYEPWLTYWVSEKDNGQADAINKGIERATGEIFNWINSDDTILPGSLAVVGNWFVEHPDAHVAFGSFDYVNADGTFHKRVIPDYKDIEQIVEYWRLDRGLTQQAMFMRTKAVRHVGPLDTTLRYNMDYELQVRLIKRFSFQRMSEESLATYRLHEVSKSVAELKPFLRERAVVARRYWPSVFSVKRWRYEWKSAKFLKHIEGRKRKALQEILDYYKAGDKQTARNAVAISALRIPSILWNRDVIVIVLEGMLGARIMSRLRAWKRGILYF